MRTVSLESIPYGKRIAISINGYGAERRPKHSFKLLRYLGQLLKLLHKHELMERIDHIYLCGGYTNRTDMSEAESMRRWIAYHAPELIDRVHLIDTTTTVQDNVRAFSKAIAGQDLHPVFVCEYSRWLTTFVLARSFMGSVPMSLVPIKFDAASLEVRHQLKQVLVNAPLEWLCLHSEVVDGWRRDVRRQAIRQAREKYLEHEQ